MQCRGWHWLVIDDRIRARRIELNFDGGTVSDVFSFVPLRAASWRGRSESQDERFPRDGNPFFPSECGGLGSSWERYKYGKQLGAILLLARLDADAGEVSLTQDEG